MFCFLMFYHVSLEETCLSCLSFLYSTTSQDQRMSMFKWSLLRTMLLNPSEETESQEDKAIFLGSCCQPGVAYFSFIYSVSLHSFVFLGLRLIWESNYTNWSCFTNLPLDTQRASAVCFSTSRSAKMLTAGIKGLPFIRCYNLRAASRVTC